MTGTGSLAKWSSTRAATRYCTLCHTVLVYYTERVLQVLLVAGKDDMQMCELSLDETGLTR